MTRRAPPFPWRQAMGFALGTLRLSPDQFWRMTPRELAATLAAVAGGGSLPMPRADFDALRARFPDSVDPAGRR